MKVKSWLQWAPVDLKGGMGGAEVCARSLHRELESQGIRSKISSDPYDLDDSWDVIHTHGPWALPKKSVKSIRAHTLHGTTLGRMWACREFLWLGGYRSYAGEVRGVLQSDLVFGVHDQLHLLKAATLMGKKAVPIWNGWDSALQPAPLSQDLRNKLQSFGKFFCFVGRGDDPMKNTRMLRTLLDQIPELKIVAVPGVGFEPSDRVFATGRLDPAQILSIHEMSLGLLVPSKYEGLPLVVLEALGHGYPVISAPAGGVPRLPENLQQFHVISLDSGQWIEKIRELLKRGTPPNPTASREANRQQLMTWKKVVENSLQAAESVLEKR